MSEILKSQPPKYKSMKKPKANKKVELAKEKSSKKDKKHKKK